MSFKYNLLGSISLGGLLLFFAGVVLSQWCDQTCDLLVEVASYSMITVGFTSSLVAKILICIFYLRSPKIDETTPLKV